MGMEPHPPPPSEYIAPPSVYDEPRSTTGLPVLMELLEPADPPLPTSALSSLDEAIIPPTLSPPDDHGEYEDLLRRMAVALNLLAEDVKEFQDGVP